MTTDKDQDTTTEEARRRGRPPQMDAATRRAHIVKAAKDLLNSRPFDDISMSAIAKEAGMSKRTLYELFDGREALLGEAIADLGRGLFRALTPEEQAMPLEQRLDTLMTINTPPGAEAQKIELLRTLISKVGVYRDIAESLCENGRGLLKHNLATELAHAREAGEIHLPEAHVSMAADILIDMGFESPILRLLSPSLPEPSPDEKAARRRLAIALFLEGCRARGA